MKFTQKNIENLELFLGVKKEIPQENQLYIHKAQKYCKIFRFIPGLLMVGIGNSLAMKAGTKDSDIDLFVVTKKNSMWFVRIMMTVLLQILGQRKTAKKHAGKFCLSFFCTEDALDFSRFIIDNDIYLFYWVLTMKPILVKEDIYTKFIGENTWANFEDFVIYQQISKDSFIYNTKEKDSLSHFVKLCNDFCEFLFLPKTLRHFKQLGKPFGVIIRNDMLKFHNKDRRKIIRDKIMTGTLEKN